MGSIIDYARTETRGFSIHPFREADALVLAQLSYDDVPDCMPRLEGVESQYGTLRNRVNTLTSAIRSVPFVCCDSLRSMVFRSRAPTTSFTTTVRCPTMTSRTWDWLIRR